MTAWCDSLLKLLNGPLNNGQTNKTTKHTYSRQINDGHIILYIYLSSLDYISANYLTITRIFLIGVGKTCKHDRTRRINWPILGIFLQPRVDISYFTHIRSIFIKYTGIWTIVNWIVPRLISCTYDMFSLYSYGKWVVNICCYGQNPVSVSLVKISLRFLVFNDGLHRI